jgi:hypothetical protein
MSWSWPRVRPSLDPGRDLPGTERLGHIVISADAGADEHVDLLRPRRDQDDVDLR